MATPVGQQWHRLLEMEESRNVLAHVLGLPANPRKAGAKEYFVELAGAVLHGRAWPSNAMALASGYPQPWLAKVLSTAPCVPPWDLLAVELPEDPDFRAYVFRAAVAWLERNEWADQLTYITQSFAWEGVQSTVEYAGDWHDERSTQTGRGSQTWVTRIKGDRDRKGITRIILKHRGRSPSEAEAGRGGYPDHGKGGDSLAIFDARAGKTEDPSEICVFHDEIERIMAGWEKLDAQMREVLRLHYFEFYSFKKIAECLDLPVGKVKNLHDEALRRLRGELGNDQEKNS